MRFTLCSFCPLSWCNWLSCDEAFKMCVSLVNHGDFILYLRFFDYNYMYYMYVTLAWRLIIVCFWNAAFLVLLAFFLQLVLSTSPWLKSTVSIVADIYLKGFCIFSANDTATNSLTNGIKVGTSQPIVCRSCHGPVFHHRMDLSSISEHLSRYGLPNFTCIVYRWKRCTQPRNIWLFGNTSFA